MLMYACPKCAETMIRAKDWFNGILTAIQQGDTTKLVHWAWFCDLCMKKFITREGWKMRTFLFQNSKRTKLIPQKEDWKGYSAYSIGETTSEQENALQMIKAIAYVVQIQDVMTRRNPEFLI